MDFLKVEIRYLPSFGALEWNGEDTLGLDQMFGTFSPHITEKAMDSAQSDVAGTDSIIAAGLKALQERGDSFYGQFFDCELAGIAFLSCRELEQQLETVAIA